MDSPGSDAYAAKDGCYRGPDAGDGGRDGEHAATSETILLTSSTPTRNSSQEVMSR